MTTSDCHKNLSQCRRCEDRAVEHFKDHAICYSCNRIVYSNEYEEIPDWAFKEYLKTKKERGQTIDEVDF